MKSTKLNIALQNQIVTVITNYKPVEKIVLFGSRCSSKHNKTSDIDLAIYSKDWISTDINIVHDRLEETIQTILKFDLLLFNKIEKESLIKEIEKGVIIYARASN